MPEVTGITSTLAADCVPEVDVVHDGRLRPRLAPPAARSCCEHGARIEPMRVATRNSGGSLTIRLKSARGTTAMPRQPCSPHSQMNGTGAETMSFARRWRSSSSSRAPRHVTHQSPQRSADLSAVRASARARGERPREKISHRFLLSSSRVSRVCAVQEQAYPNGRG
jgi:hypothetical protein